MVSISINHPVLAIFADFATKNEITFLLAGYDSIKARTRNLKNHSFNKQFFNLYDVTLMQLD